MEELVKEIIVYLLEIGKVFLEILIELLQE